MRLAHNFVLDISYDIIRCDTASAHFGRFQIGEHRNHAALHLLQRHKQSQPAHDLQDSNDHLPSPVMIMLSYSSRCATRNHVAKQPAYDV